MKSLFLPGLAALVLAVAPLRADNRFVELRGSYSGSCTVETASEGAGSVAVKIDTPRKHPGVALLTITGSLASNGNVVPIRARLRWSGKRVRSSSFLLGLHGVTLPSLPGRLRGHGGKYRFALAAAPGDELNGESVGGRLNVTLEIEDDGTLKIHGGGMLRTAAGRVPVSIVIEAARS
jgi:hypothetical protein